MTKRKQLTIATFKKKFARVREKDWIASKRKGPTGVGQTLEYYLGMKENNIALPDLGTVELKAHRVGSSSMITLFTFNRKACLPRITGLAKWIFQQVSVEDQPT